MRGALFGVLIIAVAAFGFPVRAQISYDPPAFPRDPYRYTADLFPKLITDQYGALVSLAKYDHRNAACMRKDYDLLGYTVFLEKFYSAYYECLKGEPTPDFCNTTPDEYLHAYWFLQEYSEGRIDKGTMKRLAQELASKCRASFSTPPPVLSDITLAKLCPNLDSVLIGKIATDRHIFHGFPGATVKLRHGYMDEDTACGYQLANKFFQTFVCEAASAGDEVKRHDNRFVLFPPVASTGRKELDRYLCRQDS